MDVKAPDGGSGNV